MRDEERMPLRGHPDSLHMADHVDVPAHISSVWNLVTDLDVVSRVVPRLASARWSTAGPPRLGSIGTGTTTAAGMSLRGSARIVGWEPERLVVARAVSGVLAEVQVELQPIGPMTRVRVDVAFVPPGPLRFLRGYARTAALRLMRQALWNLRSHCRDRAVVAESEPAEALAN